MPFRVYAVYCCNNIDDLFLFDLLGALAYSDVLFLLPLSNVFAYIELYKRSNISYTSYAADCRF